VGRGVGHGSKFGKLAALPADGDGADRLHVNAARLPAQPPHLLDHAGGVGRGLGVRHGEDGGVAAQRRGRRARGHRLGVLPAGFAQVGVQIHQAGEQHQALAVDDVRIRRRRELRFDAGDHPVVEQDIDGVLAVRPHPAQNDAHCSSLPPSRR
jgi:hypothetical protein